MNTARLGRTVSAKIRIYMGYSFYNLYRPKWLHYLKYALLTKGVYIAADAYYLHMMPKSAQTAWHQ